MRWPSAFSSLALVLASVASVYAIGPGGGYRDGAAGAKLGDFINEMVTQIPMGKMEYHLEFYSDDKCKKKTGEDPNNYGGRGCQRFPDGTKCVYGTSNNYCVDIFENADCSGKKRTLKAGTGQCSNWEFEGIGSGVSETKDVGFKPKSYRAGAGK